MTDHPMKPEDRALIELKPCPFCGGPAKKPIHYNGAWETGCAGDHSCAGTDVLAPLACWNTRAEGRRSPGGGGEISMLEATLCPTCRGVGLVDPEGLPEHVNDQCADAGPCPHSHNMLAWLAEHRSLELDYGFDAEEEDMFWRVHERSGNVNDREWDLIGQGETPLAALLSAKSYLEAKSADLTA